MEENILDSIKDMLGINKEDEAFDNDVLVNINSAFSTLYQIGVGYGHHYFLLNGSETWDDVFIETDVIDFIKLYTFMKVKIVFDPPTNSSVLQAFIDQMKEIEYRILLEADPANYFDGENLKYEHKVLTDEEVLAMWKNIVGENGSQPSNSLSDEDILDMWKDIMNSEGSHDSSVLLDKDLKKLWDDIMYQKGGD